MQTLFFDGVTNISISAPGLVRFDFGIASPVVDETGNQQLSWTTSQQVVMPMEGFLRAFGMQEQVMKKLMDDGLIQKRDPDPAIDVVVEDDEKRKNNSAKEPPI